MEPPRKFRKLSASSVSAERIRTQRADFLSSLSRQVSPPAQSPAARLKSIASCSTTDMRGASIIGTKQDEQTQAISTTVSQQSETIVETPAQNHPNYRAPIQLSHVQGLGAADNIDTVTLRDILGDPMVAEIWIFNFCFDVDWLMQHFDQDTRHLVKVKIVHGSWRREDMNKISIDEACKRFENVEAIQAYLPDPFGTHHSKMFIIFRHEELAQVIIHTANMLAKDWTNMTQAIWSSPLLPVQESMKKSDPGLYGTGSRFQHDLLRYLKAYGTKLKTLVQQLGRFDFEAVRAALVASVPSRLKLDSEEAWGHEALRRIITHIPKQPGNAHHAFQVSSIASLPMTWLNDTLYKATGATATSTSIIFPTAEDVRVSLDGYIAGSSIHTKAQSAAHLKQISNLRPQLCRWTAGPSSQAGRHLAAPHIKTYIRFASRPTMDSPTPDVDWALVTSANLSTQAWGSAARLPSGSRRTNDAVIHIQSYEIGVIVWPDLFANLPHENTRTDGSEPKPPRICMRPTFKSDTLADESRLGACVAFRMPYDLPLTEYTRDEVPWSPQLSYTIPDRHGLTWPPRGW